MKRVSVTELKNRLSYYLRFVKRGETVELLERDVPIARLTSVVGPGAGADARLLRLEQDGLIDACIGPPYAGFLETRPVPCQADAVRALVEERGER
ncbi:MAG: type II toxin-antitoxin system Phd/YefM family antitoxin [Armatimonadetes bacterium]|nr:type II toxin-antitoxin system Phd/YefM family antitoxin [Armatimonadota bacterium]